jgi:uncharacterized protein (DUF488 family)
MRKRQRVLLYLIQTLSNEGKDINKTVLDKMLFLLKNQYNADRYLKFYNFYPHKFGPFSNNFYLDLSDLKSRGLLCDSFQLSSEARSLSDKIQRALKEKIHELVKTHSKESVVNHVYQNYPEYCIRSELCNNKKPKLSKGVYTIGYEGHDVDSFLDKIIQNNINMVIDVRSNPFSMNFSFIGKRLKTTLAKVNIEYLNTPNLGIPGNLRRNLETQEDYRQLFKDYKAKTLSLQMEKIDWLLGLSESKRIALLCFEKDVDFCHRGVISDELQDRMTGKAVHV